MPTLTRAEAVAELKAIWTTLNADLDAALAFGRQNDTPYARRALVRAHFALVEGLSFSLRQVTVATLQDTPFLSPAELILLKEEGLTIDNKGQAQTIAERFLPFPNSLLFSIHCYVKNHGAKFTVDTNDPGWEAMRKAVKVRNKVTHPKSAAALELSPEDLTEFINAAEWWRQTMQGMFDACSEADALIKKLSGAHDSAAHRP
jgi:hypothetical protein